MKILNKKFSSPDSLSPWEMSISTHPDRWILSIQKKVWWIICNIENTIELMERKKEEFVIEEQKRKIEEIVLVFKTSWDNYLASFSTFIWMTGNVNKKDAKGDIALIRASYQGYAKIIKLLLTFPEILLNEKDRYGNTALICASYKGRTDVTQLLLTHSETLVNEKDDFDFTALICASYQGHAEIIKLLLACPEILVNEKNQDGDTALILASYKGNTDIVQILLADSRLDLTEHDQWKQALKKAETPEIKTLIEEAMRKQGIEF